MALTKGQIVKIKKSDYLSEATELSGDDLVVIETAAGVTQLAPASLLQSGTLGTHKVATAVTGALTVDGSLYGRIKLPNVTGDVAITIDDMVDGSYGIWAKIAANVDITVNGVSTFCDGFVMPTSADSYVFIGVEYDEAEDVINLTGVELETYDFGDEEGTGDVVPDPVNFDSRSAASQSSTNTYTATGSTDSDWAHYMQATGIRLPSNTAGWAAFKIAASPNNTGGIAWKDNTTLENYASGHSRYMIYHYGGNLSSADNYAAPVANNGGAIAVGHYAILAREYISSAWKIRLFTSPTPEDRSTWVDSMRGDFTPTGDALFLAGHLLKAPDVIEDVITYGFVAYP